MHRCGGTPILIPVESKTALILGGGGITGGVYELGVLSALDDGMDVSLDRISTDRFLEFAARAKSGRRYAMKLR